LRHTHRAAGVLLQAGVEQMRPNVAVTVDNLPKPFELNDFSLLLHRQVGVAAP
jgi:hypothetical protein